MVSDLILNNTLPFGSQSKENPHLEISKSYFFSFLKIMGLNDEGEISGLLKENISLLFIIVSGLNSDCESSRLSE